MNMFDWTHVFVLDNFIHYCPVYYHFLLIYVKKRKGSAIHWKSHVLNPIPLHNTATQCNKQENSIKLLKIIAVGILLQIQITSFFHFFHWS